LNIHDNSKVLKQRISVYQTYSIYIQVSVAQKLQIVSAIFVSCSIFRDKYRKARLYLLLLEIPYLTMENGDFLL